MKVEMGLVHDLFRLLQVAVSHEFQPEQWSEVQHFLNHDEYGLALEAVVDVVVEENIVVSESAIEIVVKLAEAMQLSTAEIVEKIRSPSNQHKPK